MGPYRAACIHGVTKTAQARLGPRACRFVFSLLIAA